MHTFWRLLGFLRPYRRAVLISFALAAVAMGTGVLIPFLVGQTVDEIRGDGADLTPLALAVVAAGVLRLAFSVSRRIVAGQVSLGVEYDLRNRMYQHLHSLELSFFDSQQTGQLMSRATVDLQSVRFFLGYGLIFILQSALTIVIAATVMIVLDPWLALVSLAPMPFVIWVSFRYGRLNRPASQEVQQRIAELTAEAEENIGGVRVVKAFAQEDRQLRRFDDRTRRVFEQSMVSTRLRAFYSPFIGFLPQLGLAALLFVGGKQVIDGQLSEGDFVAFYGYVLMLTSPVRMLGMALGMAQRAVASGERVFELLDRAPRRDVRLRRSRARAARRRPRRGPRADRRDRGPDRLRQDLVGDADPAALRRGRGRRAGRRRRRTQRGPSLAAPRGGGGVRRRLPVLGLAARQHRVRPPRGERRRGRGGGRAGRARGTARRSARRPRHAGRRAWPHPVRRAAPARGDRPRPAR